MSHTKQLILFKPQKSAHKTQYNPNKGSQFISAAQSSYKTPCSEQGKICAPKSFCQNGLVRSDQLSLLDDSRSVSHTQSKYTINYLFFYTYSKIIHTFLANHGMMFVDGHVWDCQTFLLLLHF